MDANLLEVLGNVKLEQHEAALVDLGVVSAGDLLVLEERDLKEIGLTVVQIRSLLRAAQTHNTGATAPRKLIRSETSSWWKRQERRPHRLIFVRHGQSEANVDRQITEMVPDQLLHLTEEGRKQALDAGVRLRSITGDGSIKFIVSPYFRARETLNGILQAYSGVQYNVTEDVRIREQEYGNFEQGKDMRKLHSEKKRYGAFYYRFPEGESPADCYDRASAFFESMYRDWEDNNYETDIVVCHGIMIIVMLMRLFKIKASEFESFVSLSNCECVVLERTQDDSKYSISYTWAAGEEKHFGDLRRHPVQAEPPIWDGTLDAPLLTSLPSDA